MGNSLAKRQDRGKTRLIFVYVTADKGLRRSFRQVFQAENARKICAAPARDSRKNCRVSLRNRFGCLKNCFVAVKNRLACVKIPAPRAKMARVQPKFV
jgi:hypothetical protein